MLLRLNQYPLRKERERERKQRKESQREKEREWERGRESCHWTELFSFVLINTRALFLYSSTYTYVLFKSPHMSVNPPPVFGLRLLTIGHCQYDIQSDIYEPNSKHDLSFIYLLQEKEKRKGQRVNGRREEKRVVQKESYKMVVYLME